MFIKSLTIQGFKSYRDQVVVDPFSERVNICVGRNGAGKSNFFSAIRFVLSDAYTSLQRAERQALLHEGSSTAATFSAFVEIVFDNSDGRMPTGKNEVILRRTIGAKKDDYSLDRKSTSKAEVMSLLESAGFSRSNPFFIVPQGRITSLTNQKDSERLELLKEIAGTRVYEDRRAESTKIMEETDHKRQKIDELLEYINKRLEELEEEKKELKEFQTADRERRCLEYAIHQHDLEETKEALAGIEAERLAEQVQQNDKREEAQARERTIAALEAEIASFRERLELITLEKAQLEGERRESIKAKTQIELLIKDLEDSSARNQTQRDNMQTSLEDLQKEVGEKEIELENIQPDFEKLLTKEGESRKSLEQAEAKQKVLFDKQGRSNQFRTQKERDAYLNKTMQESKVYLQTRVKTLDDVKRNMQSTKNALESNKQKQNDIKDNLDNTRNDIVNLSKEVEGLTSQRAGLQEQRKEGWKEDEKLAQTVRHAEEEMKKAGRTLYSTMDRSTQQGLQAVDRVADRLHLAGVYGPLYSLFECEEMFRTSVEVTAGNSLFHIVVDNDETASKILDVMVKEKLGRVTFMPLNRLKPKAVNYPEQADEAVPMISKLRFDDRFRPAMQQVFSRTILVQDLHIGNAYSRSHGLTAITLSGDKQDRKGALTGGFHDTRRSRLEAAKSVKTWTGKYESDRAKQVETRRNQNTLDQEITRLTGQITVLNNRMNRAKEAREPMQYEMQTLLKDIEQGSERLDRLQEAQKEVESEIENLGVQIGAYEEELKTPMRDALTDEEADALNGLATDIQKRKKELSNLTKDRTSLASKKSILEIELNQNLRRKVSKLREKLDAISDPIEGGGPTQANTSLTIRRAELDTLLKTIQSSNAKIEAVETESETIKNSILGKQKSLENDQGKQAEDGRGLAKQQKNVERYLAKRQILLQRKDECTKHIRDLGVLPEEAFERHSQGIKTDRLYKSLRKANEVLKKFTSVNKKAVDQYNEFTTQRDQLGARREELDTSATSIEELIEVLDQRKDEAIERTFKQVSKNFGEVFEKLVPQGRGRLIMQKRLGEEEEEEEKEEEEEEEQEVEDQEELEEEQSDEEEEGSDEDADDEPASKRQKKGKGKAVPKKKQKPTKASKGKGKAATSKSKNKGKGKALPKSKIDSYTGVSIKVSFNSKSDEGLRIQQLSGGQKSLVALAVIFAIQKCDPAPFYLFDEIDANLDADKRTAVAAMIQSLSSSAQFIITTFRPELLSEADNFLGVIFDNRKISSIRRIKQEEAYEFVETAAGAR